MQVKLPRLTIKGSYQDFQVFNVHNQGRQKLAFP